MKIKGNDQKTKSGNKGRILALKPKQILLIHEYLKTYRKELWKRQKPSKRTDYFLLNERGLQLYGSYMNRMLDKLTNKKYSPLKIRQSVIANLLKENHDLRVVQEFAGHRKTGSTEAYKRTGF
ncbi:MAG: tyrosine-type recombinase/integrase [Saprospiraceae bacterium]|nr:tyrosine-type recombinase/integrase [Saprospiraceae bacterium]